MTLNEARNELKVMVLSELAAICKRMSENPAVTDDLRAQARQLVEEFELLLPARGRGSPSQHTQGEILLIKMSRFLPRILEVQSWPSDASKL
jgi:hypothetical protein